MTEQEVTTVKRFLLVAAALVCALAIASPASAIVLNGDDVIGWVVNGTPSDLTSEIEYANDIIDLYNPTFASGPTACDGNTCYATNDGAFGVLDPVVGTGAVTVDPPFTFPVDLSGGSYDYVYAKMGGFGTLYYLGGATSLDGITTVFPPGVSTGGGLSHYVFFNPTEVPEPGTVMLLGFGLAGVVTFRRFRKC
jgi:hypothetical protein